MMKKRLSTRLISILLSILIVTSIFTVLPTSAFAAEADKAATGGKEPVGDGEDIKDADPEYIDARFYRGGKEYYGGKSGLDRFYDGDETTDISVKVFDENMNDLTSNAEFLWMYSANPGMIQMYTPVGISADDFSDTYRPLMGQSSEFWEYADANNGEWSYDLLDWGTMPNEMDFIPMVFAQSFDGVSVTNNSTMPVFSKDAISTWYTGSWFAEQYAYVEEPADLRAHDQYSLSISAMVRYQKSDGSYLYAFAYGTTVTVTDELNISGSLMYAEDEWSSNTLNNGDTVEYSSEDESTGLYADNVISSTGLRYLWFWSATQPETVSLDTMTPVGISSEYWSEYRDYLSGGGKPKDDGGKGKDGEGGLSLETLYRNYGDLWSDSPMMPVMDYSDITDGHPEQINEENGVWLACAAVYPERKKSDEGDTEEISLLTEGFIGDISVNAKIGTAATIRFYDAYDMTYEANRGETTAELSAGVKKAPEGELTYQWYRVTNSGDVAIDGATDSVYHAPIPNQGESASYYCSAACGEVTGRSDNFTVNRTAEWNTTYMSGPIGDFTIASDVSQLSIYPNMSSATYWSCIDPMKSMKVFRVEGNSYEGGTEVDCGYSGGYLYIYDTIEQGETRSYYIHFKTTDYKEWRSDIFSVTKQAYQYDPTTKVVDLRVRSLFNPVPLLTSSVPEWRDNGGGIYQYIGAETYAYFFTEDTSTTYSLSDLTVTFYRCDNDDRTGNVTKIGEVTAADLSDYPRVNDYAAIDNGLKCRLPSDTAGTYYVYADYTASIEGETVSGTTTYTCRVTVENKSHDDYFCFDEETGTITGYYGYEDVVTYPSEINGIKVKRITTTGLSDGDVKNNAGVLNGTYRTCLNVVLPEGLERIEPYTFLGEKYIETISVPNSVTKIGRYSFYHCARLKNVTVGHAEDDTFGSQLTRLEKGTFANMDSLERVDFGNCFMHINQQYDPGEASQLSSITNSFYGLPNLIDFIAPEQGSMHIESTNSASAFWHSSKLKHIENARNLEVDLPQGHYNTANFPHIYFMLRDGQDNADYDDDFVYYPDEQNDGWIIGGLLRNFTSANTTITFPDSFKGKYITGIGAGGAIEYSAMHFDNRPERILLGDHVKSIGASAFENSDRLVEVTVPLSLRRIGSRAFAFTNMNQVDRTGSLTSINLNETQLEFVGDRAFYNQKLCDFGDLHFVGGASIGDEAFALIYSVTDERTDRLASVTVDGAAHIGYRAFYNRFTLRSVNVAGRLKLDQDAFDTCYFLDTLTYSGEIEDGDIVDDSRGFSHLRYTPVCRSVTDTVLFPSNESYIKCSVTYSRSGDYAYETLENYTNQGTEEEPNWQPTGEKKSTMILYLKFGEGNIYIPATLGDDQIDTLDLTTLLSFIEAGHVIVNNGEYESGNADGEALDADFTIELDGAYTYTLYIADGIKTLNNKNGSSYTNLKNCTALRLSNTITEIPEKLFNNGQIGGTVEIPASVTRIGDKAFARNKIDSLILHDGLESIGFGAFACGDADEVLRYYDQAGSGNCRQIGALTTVEKDAAEGETLLPDSLTTIGEFAFADCSFGGSLTLPANLTRIDDGAFFGTNITEVHTDGPSFSAFGQEKWTGNEASQELISIGVFGNCKELSVIDLSKASVKDLGALSFNNSLYGYSSGVTTDDIVNKVVSLKLPRGLKNIEFNALRGINPSLVTLPEELISYHVEYLSNKINGRATSDYSITLPSTVGAVHDSIFNLGTVTFRTMRGEKTVERNSSNDYYDNRLWTPTAQANGVWALEVSDHAPVNIAKGYNEIAVFFTNRPRWSKVYVNTIGSSNQNQNIVGKYLNADCKEMTYFETDADGNDVYVAVIRKPNDPYPVMYFSNDEPMEVGVWRNSIDVAGKYGITALPASIPDGCHIRCYQDSCIYDWCVENNISCELIPSQPITLSLRIKGVDGRIFTPSDFDRIDWIDNADGTLLTSNTLVCPVHEHQSSHTYTVRVWLSDSNYAVYDLEKGAEFTYDPDSDSFSPVQSIILDKKGIAYVVGSFGSDQIHIDGFTVSAYSIKNDESTAYEEVRTDYPVTLNPDGSFFVEVPKIPVMLEASVAESEPYLPLTIKNIAYKTKGADRRIDLGYLELPAEQIIGRIPVSHRISGVTRVISADGSKQSEARIVVSGSQYYIDLTDIRGVFEIGDDVDILVSESAANGGYEPYRLTLPGERTPLVAVTLTPAQNAKVILPAHNYHVKLGAYDSNGRLFAYTTSNVGSGDVLYLPAGNYTLIAFQNSAKGNITLPDTLAEFEEKDYDIAGYAKEEVILTSGQEYTFEKEVPSAVVSSAVSASFSVDPKMADKTTGSYPVYLRYSVEESARHGDVTFRLKPLAWKDTPFVEVGGKYAFFSGDKNAKFEVTHKNSPNTADEHYLDIVTDAYEGTICFYVRPTGQPIKLYINGAYKMIYTIPANTFLLSPPNGTTTTLVNSLLLNYTNAVSAAAKVYVDGEENSSTALAIGAANKARLNYTLPETDGDAIYKISVKVYDSEDNQIWSSYTYSVTYTLTAAPVPKKLDIRVTNYNASADGTARVENAGYDFTTGEYKKMKIFVANENYNSDGTFAKVISFNYSLEVENPELAAYGEAYLKVWCNEDDPKITEVTLTYNEATGLFEGSLTWPSGYKTVDDLPYGFDLDIPTEKTDQQISQEAINEANSTGDLMSAEPDPDIMDFYEGEINIDEFRFILENGEYMEDLTDEERQAFRELTTEDIDMLIELADAKNEVVEAYSNFVNTAVPKMQNIFADDHPDDINSYFESHGINAIKIEPEADTEGKLLTLGYKKYATDYGTIYILEGDDKTVLTCLDPRFSYAFADNSRVIDVLKGKKGKAELAKTGASDDNERFLDMVWEFYDENVASWSTVRDVVLEVVSAIDLFLNLEMVALVSKLATLRTKMEAYNRNVLPKQRTERSLAALRRTMETNLGPFKFKINGQTRLIARNKGYANLTEKQVAEKAAKEIKGLDEALQAVREELRQLLKEGPPRLSKSTIFFKTLKESSRFMKFAKAIPLAGGIIGLVCATMDLIELADKGYEVLNMMVQDDPTQQWIQLYIGTVLYGDIFGLNLRNLPEDDYWDEVDHRFDNARTNTVQQGIGVNRSYFQSYEFNTVEEAQAYRDKFGSYMQGCIYAENSSRSFLDLTDDFEHYKTEYAKAMCVSLESFKSYYHRQTGIVIANFVLAIGGFIANPTVMAADIAGLVTFTIVGHENGELFESLKDDVDRQRNMISEWAERRVRMGFLPNVHHNNVYQDWLNIFVSSTEWDTEAYHRLAQLIQSRRQEYMLPYIAHYSEIGGGYLFDEDGTFVALTEEYRKKVMSAIDCDMDIFETLGIEPDDPEYDFSNIDFGELEDYASENAPDSGPEYETPTPCPIDPSGYVYEAVASNRVEGATAKIYYRDKDGNAKLWDEAEEYDEVNPQTTDTFGKFGWMTPIGQWKVVVNKDGYETADSSHDPAALNGWLLVPPPQVDVNIGLVSTAAPTVSSVTATADTVQVVFSQYMDIVALETDNSLISVSQGGQNIPVSFAFADREVSPTDNSKYYGRILNITRTDGEKFAQDILSLKVKKQFVNYAGTAFTDDYTASDLPLSQLVAEIIPGYEKGITATAGKERTISVTVKDSSGNSVAGEAVTMSAAYGDLLILGNTTAITDANGEAVFTITGNRFGKEVLTFISANSVTATASAYVSDKDPVLLGDADGDGEVTILDATAIQRKLAAFTVESFNEEAASITDMKLNILDATVIQRYLAGFSSAYSIGKDM